MTLHDLNRLCDGVLRDTLPQSLKDAIDCALEAGMTKREILRRLRRKYGRRFTVLAVEAYLGADSHGNIK